MRKFKIAVSWEETGEIEVEAETLEEACNIAEKWVDDGNIHIPVDACYVESSYVVSYESSKFLNNIKDG